jgi:hypothetical protein
MCPLDLFAAQHGFALWLSLCTRVTPDADTLFVLLCTEVLPEWAALCQGHVLPNCPAVQRGECDVYTFSCTLHHMAHISITSSTTDIQVHAAVR